jgi:hypothetical protein
MCQCAERRAVIVQAVAGELPVGLAAAIVVSSLAQDARAISSSALSAARARLSRRRP